jgi:hypothetical protein
MHNGPEYQFLWVLKIQILTQNPKGFNKKTPFCGKN